MYHLTGNGHIRDPSYVHENLYGVIILGANIVYTSISTTATHVHSSSRLFKEIPMVSKGNEDGIGAQCEKTHF